MVEDKQKIVIKVGGALVAQGIDNLIYNIKELHDKYHFIIIHGGGPQINALYESMNKEPKIYKTPKGFPTRYTDPEAMDIIKMALAGSVNKTLVEKMQKMGLNAFGFTGADGNTVVAERKDKIMVLTDMGKRLILRNEFSGKNATANIKIINYLLENDMIPVIGSTSISENGELLNMDGDRVANAIAKALNVDILMSLTDVPGIYKDMKSRELIKHLKLAETDYWLNQLSGGMKKKLYSAIKSIKAGIKKVIITSGSVENPINKTLQGEMGTSITLE